MTEQQREPGALDMWKARQGVVISGIAVDQAHRQQADADRAEVKRLTGWADELAREVAQLRAELDEARGYASDRDELADEVARLVDERAVLTAERDRARDLAVRAGAFDSDSWFKRWDDLSDMYGELESKCAELEAERDQALYERDSARAVQHGA